MIKAKTSKEHRRRRVYALKQWRAYTQRQERVRQALISFYDTLARGTHA